MEKLLTCEKIITKLKNGEKFGLFDEGANCYFQDGTRARYQDLWQAIRIVNAKENGKPCGTLAFECPNSFVGIFPYKYSKHNWKATNLKDDVSSVSRV